MFFKPLRPAHSVGQTPQLSPQCCSNPSTQPSVLEFKAPQTCPQCCFDPSTQLTVLVNPHNSSLSVVQTPQLSPQCSKPSTQLTVLEFKAPVPGPQFFRNPILGAQSRSKPIYLAHSSGQNSSTGPTGCSNHLFPAHSVQLFMVHAINVIKRMLSSIRLKHGAR